VTLPSGSRWLDWGQLRRRRGAAEGGGEAEGHQGECGWFGDFAEVDAGIAEGNIELAVAEEVG